MHAVHGRGIMDELYQWRLVNVSNLVLPAIRYQILPLLPTFYY